MSTHIPHRISLHCYCRISWTRCSYRGQRFPRWFRSSHLWSVADAHESSQGNGQSREDIILSVTSQRNYMLFLFYITLYNLNTNISFIQNSRRTHTNCGYSFI